MGSSCSKPKYTAGSRSGTGRNGWNGPRAQRARLRAVDVVEPVQAAGSGRARAGADSYAYEMESAASTGGFQPPVSAAPVNVGAEP